MADYSHNSGKIKESKKKKNTATEMVKSGAGMPSDISNKVFGVPENKTTTIEPLRKEDPSYLERLSKDLKVATGNTGFGMGGAEMSGAKPTEQQMQNDVDIVNDISAKTGMDITSPYAIRNLPVDKEEVDKYLEDPANYKAGEEPKREITETSEKPSVKPTLEDIKFAQQYYDDYRLPKNGAEYLKQLWGQGATGKAKAVGNVIGNLLGKAGTINVAGAQGQGRDFTSDWENYVNNYQKEMADRNARIFNDNMDIVKQASTNAQARKDLVAQLELALKNAGKLDANAMRLLQIWSTATTPSSALDRGISALMTLIPEGVFK